ncbi:hypothetical protein, partial [Streptacidiphilus jiangxiensis]
MPVDHRDRNRWIAFERRADAFAPVSVAQSLAAGVGVAALTAVSGIVALAVTQWNIDQWQVTPGFGLVLKALGFYPLLPGLCALILSAAAVVVSVAAVFDKGGLHEDSDDCTCRRCRWSHWIALDMRPWTLGDSLLRTAVNALVIGLAADTASAVGFALYQLPDGLPKALRVAGALLGIVPIMAAFIARMVNVLWSISRTQGVFSIREHRIWSRENRTSPALVALHEAFDDGDPQERLFRQFLTSGQLPRRISGEGETAETYRLLGVDAQWTDPQDALGLVAATWPAGWELVRQEIGAYWFELVDETGTPMAEGLVNSKIYDPRAHVRLTDAGRREVRRRWYALPEDERALVQQRGGPWTSAYPTVEDGPRFAEADNYALVAARLRARGWTIGVESPSGLQISLSDAASAWTAERTAGEVFWLLPGDFGAPVTGAAGPGAYPWYPQATQASWQDPGALADEIDQILRHGYRDDHHPDGQDIDA